MWGLVVNKIARSTFHISIKTKKTKFIAFAASLSLALFSKVSLSTQLGVQDASLSSSCAPLFVAVVNPTQDPIELIGKTKKIRIKPHSAGEYKIKQKNYYTSCGRFDVKTKTGIRKMLIEQGAARVSLRYQGGGKFQSEGVKLDNVDEYVKWNGLRDVL
jgi:hypothetical protein